MLVEKTWIGPGALSINFWQYLEPPVCDHCDNQGREMAKIKVNVNVKPLNEVKSMNTKSMKRSFQITVLTFMGKIYHYFLWLEPFYCDLTSLSWSLGFLFGLLYLSLPLFTILQFWVSQSLNTSFLCFTSVIVSISGTYKSLIFETRKSLW